MSQTYHYKQDGYNFGDRLLEGVLFDVEVTGTADAFTFEVACSGPSDRYLEQLNRPMWMERCREFVSDTLNDLAAEGQDVFHEVLSEPNPDGSLEF